VRSKVILVGLVVLAALAGACGGGGGNALKMLPSDTNVVMGFDLGKAKGTAVWKAGEDLYKTFAKDDAMKASMEDGLDKVKKFTKKTGLDPMEDLATVTVGLTAIAGMGDGPQQAAIITLKKDADEKDIVDYIEEETKTDLDKEEVKGMNVYSMGKEGSFAFFDKKTIVAGSPDFVSEMVELKGGKGKSASENKELAAAMKKVEGGSAAWFAMAVTEDMAKGMKGAPVKGLDDATDVSASVNLSKGIKIVAKIGFEKADQASDVVDELEKMAKEGKKSAKDMGKDMPFMKDLVEAYKIEAKGNDATITIDITEDTLADVVKWAKKSGKDMLPMLMGGGMGMKMPPPDGDGTGGGGDGDGGHGGGGGGGGGAADATHGGGGPDHSDSLADIVDNVKGSKLHEGLDNADKYRDEIGNILEDAAKSGKTDVLLVIDATGTMVPACDALAELRGPFKTFLGDGNRMAVASFKDEGDEYVSKLEADFTDDAGTILDAIKKVKENAGGGGDLPEGIYEGLSEAAKLDWKASDKVVILVSDADGAHPREPARGKTYDWFKESGAHLSLVKPSFF